ncbi:MAG: hypothetical protein AAF371_11985 [Pseudomonadota bacterium]
MTNPFEVQANFLAGMATLWSAAALAGFAAVMANASRPWVGGDVNAPFSRDFSMDIDPVTSWTLPALFGHARGSREAAEFLEAFAQQQLLVRALIEDCRARPSTRDADGDDMAEMRLPPAQARQLQDVTERLGTLAKRGQRL